MGTDFAQTLRAAQAGEEDAFVRLWRDANPAMVRYLRVVGHDDPYDEACEGWLAVVRGLPGFSGDETDWRVWVLACARQRAEEGLLRRAWGSATDLEGFTVDGDGDIDLDEVLQPGDTVDPSRRGLADTLTALRALPLGQGEVVVLRLGAELPPCAVASVVGDDEANVERAATRGLERLATAAELVSWSLAAPPSPAELADEKVAVGAFRTVLSRARAESVKVIAVGSGNVRAGARHVSSGATASGPRSASRSERRPSERRPSERGPSMRGRTDRGRTPSDARDTRRTGGRGTTVAGRSRTAVLALTALSLSVVSLGGLGAAAYVGVLPTPVQQALHDAVGAPAPAARDEGSPSTRRQPVAPPSARAGSLTANNAAAGLCRAWSTDQAKGTARERSTAFQKLSTAAGGPAKVQAYCSTALAPKPPRGTPTASVGGTSPATPGTAKGTGKDTGKGKGSTGTTTPRSTPGANPHATPGATHTPQGTPANTAKPTRSTKAEPTSQATPPLQPTAKGKKSGRG